MLLISSAAFYNVAQSYVVLWQTKEIYGKKPEQGQFRACLSFSGGSTDWSTELTSSDRSYEQIVGDLEFVICNHQVQDRLQYH